MTTNTPDEGMPEEPNYLRLRNGFTVGLHGREEPTYGQYVLRNDYDKLRAHAESLQARLDMRKRDIVELNERAESLQRRLDEQSCAFNDWHCESEGCAVNKDKYLERAQAYRLSFDAIKLRAERAERLLVIYQATLKCEACAAVIRAAAKESK